MDKKAFLAIALSLGIWVGWQKFYLEPIQKQAAQQTQAQADEAAKAQAKRDTLKADLEAKGFFPEAERKRVALKRDETKLVLENADTKMGVSNASTAVKTWDLKTFSATLEKKEEKISLSQVTGFDAQGALRFSDPAYTFAAEEMWDSITQTSPLSAVSRLSGEGLVAERTVTLDEKGYGARVDYKLRFTKTPPKYVFLDLVGSLKRANDHEGSIFGQAPDKVHATYRDSQSRHSDIAAAMKENREAGAGVKWLGLDTRYFVLALVPQGEEKGATGAQVTKDSPAAGSVRSSLAFPTNDKKEVSISTRLYFGPKDLESLKSADPVLTDTVDFGFFSFLAIPLLHSLKWLYAFLHNYGLAIIFLTFFIKMLLFPLTYKSMKSMAKISKLQPQLNALREKYKDDKEKLNMEMMSFMKTNGYNPLGGCLPILVQMPIFFALYRVLFNSMELYQAPFFGWIQDLSSPDPWFITPVLLTGLMYFQQKLSPNTAADPTQQKMLQFMPVMFGVFMIMLPAGLNIYMVVNSAVSIAQQYYLNRKLGITVSAAKPVKA